MIPRWAIWVSVAIVLLWEFAYLHWRRNTPWAMYSWPPTPYPLMDNEQWRGQYKSSINRPRSGVF